MKRLWAVVCVVALLCGVIPAANLGQVEATDGTVVVEEKLTTGSVVHGSGNDYSKEGYVFGGFFDDYDEDTKQFDNPIMEEKNATEDDPIYIKWVPKAVMNVKAQVRQDGYKKVLTSCDSKDGASNICTDGVNNTSGGVCTDEKYVLEGTGSLRRQNVPITSTTSATTYYNIYLNESVNVLGYKYFSCKLYLSNIDVLSATKNRALSIVVKAGYGNSDKDALQFYLDKSDLKEGWNEIKLPFTSAEVIRNGGTESGTWDGTKINYIRILQVAGGSEGTIHAMYLDDVCVMNDSEGILVADCDQIDSPKSTGSQKENTLVCITTTDKSNYDDNLTITDNAKEGTGALKVSAYNYVSGSTNEYRLKSGFLLSNVNALKIESYKNTGSLHFWMYISNVANLQDNFTLRLTSGTSITNYAMNYTIEKADLDDGWNEISIPLSKMNAIGSNPMDWTAVKYILIQNKKAATADTYSNMYMIIDDIRIINRVQVASCDSTDEIITDTSATYYSAGVQLETTNQKVGDGAFSNNFKGKIPHKLILSDAVDFSAFKDNGCLHFWWYIENPTCLGASEISIELASDSGANGSNRKTYQIKKDNLVEGWNEIFVYLGDVTDTATGTMSWSAIDFIRINDTTGSSAKYKSMIDDISLIPGNAETLDVRFVSTVDSLDYQSVGYEITQSRSQNPLKTETKNVYKRIWAAGKAGVLDNAIPSDISGVDCSTYMHLATLVNIPIRLWDATFTVTPYWKTQDGTVVKGDAQTYTMNKLMSITKQSQEDTDFRVIVTSDVHYTDLNGPVNGYNADGRLQLWVNSILQEHEKKSVDLVIVNGDTSLDYRSAGDGGDLLVNDRSGTELFVKNYVSQLRAKGISVVVLPGNHEQYSENDWRELTGNNRNETYELGNNLFIMPDSYGTSLDPQEDDQKSDGTYSKFDVASLKKMMSQYPEHNVYIVSHYIDMEPQDPQFLNLLQTNENIVGLFSGHTHSGLTLGGEDDTTYGRKTVAQTGHFSWKKDSTSWGFRDLVITADSAKCQYISVAENNGTITCIPDASTMITYYSSEQ